MPFVAILFFKIDFGLQIREEESIESPQAECHDCENAVVKSSRVSLVCYRYNTGNRGN